MERNQPTGDDAGQLDRRSVLKLTGAAVGSGVTMSGVVSAKRGNGKGGGGGGGGKSGGRGQTSDPVELDEPFTIEKERHFETNASCMSDESEAVHYVRYSFEYCNVDIGPDEKTLCVRPGRSDVDEDRVYEFRAAQDCKAPSSDFQTRFSFGPSNSEHDC